MFGMGFTEIILILIVAIVFLGPDKLPQVAVNIAKFFKSFKNTVNDAKESINKEIGVEELRQNAIGYKEKIDSVTDEIKRETNLDTISEIKQDIDSLKDSVSFKSDKSNSNELNSNSSIEREVINFKNLKS